MFCGYSSVMQTGASSAPHHHAARACDLQCQGNAMVRGHCDKFRLVKSGIYSNRSIEKILICSEESQPGFWPDLYNPEVLGLNRGGVEVPEQECP